MADHLQKIPEREPHNILDLVSVAGSGSLVTWACRYLSEKVYGIQSPHTFKAKLADLQGFLQWYARANGHAEIGDWHPRDTYGYLEHLKSLRIREITVTLWRGRLACASCTQASKTIPALAERPAAQPRRPRHKTRSWHRSSIPRATVFPVFRLIAESRLHWIVFDVSDELDRTLNIPHQMIE